MFNNRNKMLLAVLIIITLAVATGVARGTGLINAVNPQGSAANVPPLPAPLLIPPASETYQQLADGVKQISTTDNRPIAQLANPPAGFEDGVSYLLPDQENDIPNLESEIYFRVLASVKYVGNGHTILVTTTRPSSKAATVPTIFGNQQVELRNGITAWISTDIPTGLPSNLVFIQEDLVITVASDLTIKETEQLAANVVIP